ncbi:MAG: ABC transporter ATP-binding protein [Planctomycetes bacterium]|nr:ABC transporter ATP-binding protein [Planctomycetota bacterium]
MIEVDNLTKRFGQTLAVDAVSFTIGRGEVVGFLGPNGAGKTTTIRVLTCFHPATAGTARVAGFDVFDEPVKVRQQIGYLPENVPIYGDMRVEGYLRYRAALKGVPRRERRAAVARAMERCGVTEVRRKLVSQVSRGYRQRVGLADALVANPPILILDEPTSGLDPNQRRKIKDLVRELAVEHTILFSSHILAEVGDVSDRILLIDRGRLLADGRIDELLANAGGERIVVTARAPGEELVAALAGTPGCGPFAALAEAGAFATVAAELERDAAMGDPRDAIAARLGELDVQLRELRTELPALEQYFARMTGGGDRAASRPQSEAPR